MQHLISKVIKVLTAELQAQCRTFLGVGPCVSALFTQCLNIHPQQRVESVMRHMNISLVKCMNIHTQRDKLTPSIMLCSLRSDLPPKEFTKNYEKVFLFFKAFWILELQIRGWGGICLLFSRPATHWAYVIDVKANQRAMRPRRPGFRSCFDTY